jgi:hypothetical protein
MTLNLDLRRPFAWQFIVVNIDIFINGMGFLIYYNLLVDARNQKLSDDMINIACKQQSANNSKNIDKNRAWKFEIL